MMRKGQAALEYLTTYGWVLMVVVIGIGTLAYFGFLSPQKFIPERCQFGSQLVCEDYLLNTTHVKWRVRNNFAKDINVTAIQEGPGGFALINCKPSVEGVVKISVGTVEELYCTIGATLYKGDKYSIPVEITFKRSDSNTAPNHIITGEIYSRAS